MDDFAHLSQKELVARLQKLQELSASDKELIEILRAKTGRLEESVATKSKEAEGVQRNYEGLSNMTVPIRAR